MARTTEAAVQGIIEHDSSISLTPFIEIANDLVTSECLDSGYSAARLELIERWLAAHFYAIRDNRVASEGAGSVTTSYQFRVGLNLNVTIYGQQVLLMDTDGNFAALQAQAEGKGPTRASIVWLGKTTEEQEESE